MITRRQAAAGGTGGFAILLGLATAGVGPFSSALAGLLAFAGSFNPALGEAISLAGNSIPSAEIASDSYNVQVVFQALPSEYLKPVSGLIVGVAIALLAVRIRENDS